MSVGLQIPSLEQCIKLFLFIIVIGAIITRSKKILLLSVAFILFCCLCALAHSLYKKFGPRFGPHEVAANSEGTQETSQISPCPESLTP